MLKIEATEGSPLVEFNNDGQLHISGRALPEDAVSFFAPLKEWISTYSSSPAASTVLEMDLEYFNSSASRQIIEILIQLEEMNGEVKVVWKYAESDELMKYRGQELESFVEIPFDFIGY